MFFLKNFLQKIQAASRIICFVSKQIRIFHQINGYLSCDSKIVTEEKMDSRNVPIRMNNIQPIELWIFILNSILLQSFLHIQRPSQSFPNITSSMFVEFQITVQNLSDCLLRRHLQDGGVIINHVNYSDSSRFFSQSADDILRIFPPLDLAIRIHMQILSCRTIKLPISCFNVDSHSWLSTI